MLDGAEVRSRVDRVLPLVELLDRLRADEAMLAAAILHEFPADPGDAGNSLPPGLTVLLEGQQIASRVWSLHATTSGSNAEGLRRLLLAMVRDLRVVFILLARQLVAMRQVVDAADERRLPLAQLTADIHAPLANRLGIWQLKWELEDLAFRCLQPDVYRRISSLVDERRDQRDAWIDAAKAELQSALRDGGIDAEVSGRPKHIYSIWRKMQRKGYDFEQLHDIRAMRVMVRDIPGCYAVLGIVHSLWASIPGEFDDYIANPKGNHYQSLHTAVVGPDGRTLEVQIRTPDMHEHAELGVAAHWRYKEGGSSDAQFERKISWLRQLLDAKDDGEDEAALLAGFRTDVLDDRVYLLTPQGEVKDLPRGATVLDFAYRVHTNVGHRCRGAKVNDRIVSLTHQPTTGDRIEILTGKELAPRRDWLSAHHGFLNTARAREKVRTWFKRIDRDHNVNHGKATLERELKRLGLGVVNLETMPERFQLRSLDDLHEAIALGDISAGQVARAMHEIAPVLPAPRVPSGAASARADAVVIEGLGNLLTTMARCCQPLPGDEVLGFITRGRGISIHRDDCKQLQKQRYLDPDRVVEVRWGRAQAAHYDVDIQLRGYDRKWLLKDVTNVIAAANVYVIAVNNRVDPDKGVAEMRYSVRVTDFSQLSMLLAKLQGIPNIFEARRLV